MTYEIGQQASLRKTITEADVVLFAGISLDTNPVHLDELAARETRFGRRIARPSSSIWSSRKCSVAVAISSRTAGRWLARARNSTTIATESSV